MWKIIPLNLGTLTVKKNGLLYGIKTNEITEVPCIGWLLTNESGKNILVDSGPSDNEVWGTQYHNPLRKTKDQKLENLLLKNGIRTEELNLCILTHLHWDHAYGVLKIPKAKILVQREELRYAIDPLPPDWKHYELNIEGKNPFFLDFFKQIETINGDTEIDRGLKILHLPGHSPGSQGILVTTEEGEFLIAGDLINIMEGWQSDPIVPPGIFYSLEDCYLSFNKVKKLNATVLPGHEWQVFKMFSKVEVT